LHEHERRNVPIVSKEAYRAAAASLFQNPEHLVFGDETAIQAGDRFRESMSAVLNKTDGDLVVVSHGTVISLFVAESNDVDVFNLWLQLGLPSFVVLSRPSLQFLDVVTEV
jgi:broad specificity phosphatase PhoE